MKWMTLVPIVYLLTACGNPVVEYQQVVVTPPCANLTLVDVAPVDVTNTVVSTY